MPAMMQRMPMGGENAPQHPMMKDMDEKPRNRRKDRIGSAPQRPPDAPPGGQAPETALRRAFQPAWMTMGALGG